MPMKISLAVPEATLEGSARFYLNTPVGAARVGQASWLSQRVRGGRLESAGCGGSAEWQPSCQESLKESSASADQRGSRVVEGESA